jgi:ABC-2 type transport system ATP-binding protein
MATADLEHRIEFLVEGSLDVSRLGGLPGVTRAMRDGDGEYTLLARQVQPAIKSLMDLSETNGFTLRGLTVEGATLEDVFLHLTGRRIRA